MCDIADSEWHSSIDHSESGCVAEVRTEGGDCETFCESVGSRCIYAQDNINYGGCTLNSDHERQSTINNGCSQTWGAQVVI